MIEYTTVFVLLYADTFLSIHSTRELAETEVLMGKEAGLTDRYEIVPYTYRSK